MRKFSQHFGEGERLSLETTFRCVDRIAAVATEFILRNPSQIPKTVRSVHRAEGPCVHIGLPGEQKLSLLKEVLDKIAVGANGFDEISTVLLLGRYNHLRPQNLSSLVRQYPTCSSRTRVSTDLRGWRQTMSWCSDCVPQNTVFPPKLQTTRCSTWSLLRRKRIRTPKRGACFMLPSPALDAIPSCSPRAVRPLLSY